MTTTLLHAIREIKRATGMFSTTEATKITEKDRITRVSATAARASTGRAPTRRGAGARAMRGVHEPGVFWNGLVRATHRTALRA